MSGMRLRPEAPEDGAAVEALLDLCFGPGRTALSSYRLREGVAPLLALCRVARADGALAGAIRFWPVRVGAAPALLLGPVAVHPTRQGEGLGALLIEEGLAAARRAGWRRALLVGDAPYYGRFGFARLDGVEMPPPTNPDRVLGRALAPGAWDAVRGPVLRWGGGARPGEGPARDAQDAPAARAADPPAPSRVQRAEQPKPRRAEPPSAPRADAPCVHPAEPREAP